jgi:hypothetical protein
MPVVVPDKDGAAPGARADGGVAVDADKFAHDGRVPRCA